MQIAGSLLYLLAYGDNVIAGDPQGAMRQVCGDVLGLYVLEKTSSRFTNLELNMFVDPANQPTGGRSISQRQGCRDPSSDPSSPACVAQICGRGARPRPAR